MAIHPARPEPVEAKSASASVPLAAWLETTPRPGKPRLDSTAHPEPVEGSAGTFLDRALIAGLGLLGTAIVIRFFLPF